jgi:hypothetical protein
LQRLLCMGVAVQPMDLRALLDECSYDRAADASGGAGDDGVSSR